MLAATAAVSNTDAHVSVFSLLGRLLISLFVVLMVLWVLAQIVRRKGMPGSRGQGGRAARRQVDVVARQSIGKGQTLVTVRLDDRIVLLGVTAQSITTLSELDPAAYGILPGSGTGTGTGQVLELEAVTSDAADPRSVAGTDADGDPQSDSDAPRPLPSTTTSASSASSSAGSMSSTMFSWNQRLDRLRDRTVRR
jgi:flagellar protein FliO/FliZ